MEGFGGFVREVDDCDVVLYVYAEKLSDLVESRILAS